MGFVTPGGGIQPPQVQPSQSAVIGAEDQLAAGLQGKLPASIPAPSQPAKVHRSAGFGGHRGSFSRDPGLLLCAAIVRAVLRATLPVLALSRMIWKPFPDLPRQ